MVKIKKGNLFIFFLFIYLFCSVPLFALADPLDNWHTRNPLSTGNHLNGITYGNNYFVAVGTSGTILTSPDGINWSSNASGTTDTLNGIAYGNGIFLVGGNSGATVISRDGIIWTYSKHGLDFHNHNGIVFGNDRFVVGSSASIGGGVLWNAMDGVTWAGGVIELYVAYYGVAYGNNLYIAAGTRSSNGGYDQKSISKSPDGSHWTSAMGISSAIEGLNGATYGNNFFVVVGDSGQILTSVDGNGWTTQESGTTNNLYGVAYGRGTFVAVGDCTILTSSDGIVWASRNSGTATCSFKGVTYSNGSFIVVGNGGTILQSDPYLLVAPAAFDYGKVELKPNTKSQVFSILNNDNNNLTIGIITLGGVNNSDFILQNDNCSEKTLTPSESCTLEVLFSPESIGIKNADLLISSSDPDTPLKSIPLLGHGITIQVTQSILNFGYVPPGSYKDLTLEVKNIGSGILTGTVSATPPFSIVSGGSYSLSANQTQQVVVRYTAPLEKGAQTGSLIFTGGGGLTIQVKGTNKKAGLPWLMLLLD